MKNLLGSLAYSSLARTVHIGGAILTTTVFMLHDHNFYSCFRVPRASDNAHCLLSTPNYPSEFPRTYHWYYIHVT